MSLLEVRDLKKHFPIKTGVLKRTTGHVYAVDGVSFYVEKGETLGLVGESGCGKSTTGRAVLRLIEATAGSVMFEGIDVMKASRSEMQTLRRDMQIIFQDPYASLNPRMRVRDIVGESLKIHGIGTEAERKKRVFELLETVGLSAEHAERYPHEFSGGQRQRIGIARALALNPKLIICDEPVSALDVSIRAQVINLLEDLQDEFDLTYLFIAHDLSVVKHISDRVAVHVPRQDRRDLATARVLYDCPQHPYTEALLSAVPIPDPHTERARRRIILEGDVPSPANPPKGCVFHPRCPRAQEICTTAMPALVSTGGDAGERHEVACYFPARFADGMRTRRREAVRRRLPERTSCAPDARAVACRASPADRRRSPVLASDIVSPLREPSLSRGRSRCCSSAGGRGGSGDAPSRSCRARRRQTPSWRGSTGARCAQSEVDAGARRGAPRRRRRRRPTRRSTRPSTARSCAGRPSASG